MEVNNPYLEQKRELILKIDRLEREYHNITDAKGKKEAQEVLFKARLELDETEAKSREFTQAILDDYYSRFNTLKEKPQEIKVDKDKYPSLNKQLVAVRELHKEVKEFEKEVKELKYSYYDLVKKDRENRKI